MDESWLTWRSFAIGVVKTTCGLQPTKFIGGRWFGPKSHTMTTTKCYNYSDEGGKGLYQAMAMLLILLV
jgi:hypothetical protein